MGPNALRQDLRWGGYEKCPFGEHYPVVLDLRIYRIVHFEIRVQTVALPMRTTMQEISEYTAVRHMQTLSSIQLRCIWGMLLWIECYPCCYYA